MDCPLCGQRMVRRDVVGRAAADSVEQPDGSHEVWIQLKPRTIAALECRDCQQTFYLPATSQ
jgi:hypothetical protein